MQALETKCELGTRAASTRQARIKQPKFEETDHTRIRSQGVKSSTDPSRVRNSGSDAETGQGQEPESRIARGSEAESCQEQVKGQKPDTATKSTRADMRITAKW